MDVLNGDACTVEMRHEEYVREKLRYASHKQITKNDRRYLEKHPNAARRCFVYIQKRIKQQNDGIVVCTDGSEYKLINMDAYFYASEEKKNDQMSKLKRYDVC